MPLQKPVLLIALNEINFDIVKAYCDQDQYPSLKKIANNYVPTTSETKYENLEPWIQWVSVYTGKTAEQHGIFRLGDVVNNDDPQIYELLEAGGYKVGAISPMNAANRLQEPAYFIPDPWTLTDPDDSSESQRLTLAIRQVVNDNTQSKITLSSAMTLITTIARYARPKNYPLYLKLLIRSLRDKWNKALFLDLFLSDFHIRKYKTKRPDFSSVFLNAGAHIQHHYLLNAKPFSAHSPHNPDWYLQSKKDPFKDMLEVYERIVTDHMDLPETNCIYVTGLSQKPYEKNAFYWRLKDHAEFLNLIGAKFKSLAPRMTRDFLVECHDASEAAETEGLLKQLISTKDGTAIFSEIDNRGSSLFVTLTYPNNIEDTLPVKSIQTDQVFDMKPYLVFVAIKNGMHDEKGYVYFDGDISSPKDGAQSMHIKELKDLILDYFPKRPASLEMK